MSKSRLVWIKVSSMLTYMLFITTVVCLGGPQEMLVRIQLIASKPLLRSCNFSQYKTFPEYLSTPVQRILNRRFQYKDWKFIGSFRKRFAFIVQRKHSEESSCVSVRIWVKVGKFLLSSLKREVEGGCLRIPLTRMAGECLNNPATSEVRINQ